MKSMLLGGTMLAMMSVAAALAQETPPVPAPAPPAPKPVEVSTCPYDLVPTAVKEDVRRALGVIPCSLNGKTPLVANAEDSQTKIRSENGHYFPRVTIKGVAVRMMADTGATVVSLSAEDARRIGIDPQSLQFTGKVQTANGPMRKAPVTLPEITIEGFVLRDIPAACCVTGISLLGMSALERLSFKMNNGWMFLSRKS
jgi:clan AA aspartic protease (TIGR02281 family)